MLAMCNEEDNSKFESEYKSSSDELFIRLPRQDGFNLNRDRDWHKHKHSIY